MSNDSTYSPGVKTETPTIQPGSFTPVGLVASPYDKRLTCRRQRQGIHSNSIWTMRLFRTILSVSTRLVVSARRVELAPPRTPIIFTRHAGGSCVLDPRTARFLRPSAF